MCVGRENPVTRVSNGMSAGADLPRPVGRPQSAANGLFIALVIQIPTVSALVGSAALSHRVDQRERETLSITLSHFLFLLLALLTFPFLLRQNEIWRPSCQF